MPNVVLNTPLHIAATKTGASEYHEGALPNNAQFIYSIIIN